MKRLHQSFPETTTHPVAVNRSDLRKTAASVEPGDKVVSLYDSRCDLLPQRDSPPDAWFGMGQVCRVSGISVGGNIVWLCSVHDPSRREYGFHPWLVCPLPQFQSRFPNAISAIPKRNRERLGQRRSVDSQSIPGQLPEIAGGANLRLTLLHALGCLEHLFSRQESLDRLVFRSDRKTDQDAECDPLILDFNTRQIHSELCDLFCCHPRLVAHLIQARVLWQMLRRRRRLIIFTRNLSPVANLLIKLCSRGRTNILPRIIAGSMKESDFVVVTRTAGRLVHSPVRICDAREAGTFPSVLREAHPHFDYALCDWRLSAREKAEAYRVARDSWITFLCPGQ